MAALCGQGGSGTAATNPLCFLSRKKKKRRKCAPVGAAVPLQEDKVQEPSLEGD